ncbi:hypothetical protein F9C28_18660 [Shimwellia pseudoproteus]|uniref:hypothetical protein n=1 Tax=Shimwellia pseudoproteus TaxID=570012 RepID=UPI0018ECAB6E|nr:hypothetical protein [Shimwellia pseudoproteus]MBJ3816870.1 hypothetical protein [Shimwellia pseudoproteus]
MPPSQYRKSPRFFNRSFTPPISLYHPVELKTPVIIQREAICCRGDNDILNCDASIGEQDYLRFSRQIQRDYLHKYGEYARLAVTHVRSNQSKHYISFDKYVGTGVSQPVSGRNTALLPAGNYARFIYQGDGRNYFYFLMQAHAYLLNEMHFRKIGEYFIESIVAMSHQDTEVPEFTLHLDIPVYDDGLPQEDKQPRWLAPASPRDLTCSAVMEGA